MDNSGVAAVAAALEVQMWRQFPTTQQKKSSVDALEFLLREVLSNIHPSEHDCIRRLEIISRFTSILQYSEHFKGASVKPFGSFESNLYTRWGDLDISVEMPPDVRCSSTIGKNKKKKALKDLRQALIRGGVARQVQFIPSARVPLLIFEDPHSQISCDVSINNYSGCLKSRFFYWISQIDTRFRDLVFLVKYWAKAHNINDPKTGTLNSFSLSLLVIFHLQTRAPPILPPFKEIYNGDIADELAGKKGKDSRQIEEECRLNVQRFKLQGFGSGNKSSISELFLSFFAQYAAVAPLWLQGLTVSTFSGKWGDASTNECYIKKQYVMTVEDPFDHVENCARSVTESTLETISDAFLETAQSLHRSPVFFDMHSLRQSLFGWPQGRLKSSIMPSQVNSVKRSGTSNEDSTNLGRPPQICETTFYNLTVRSEPFRSLDSLPAAFSHGCSVDERSMPGQPKAFQPAVYSNRTGPAFQYNASHHDQQSHPSQSRQPTSIARDFRDSRRQEHKIWKPKNGSLGS